MRRPGGAAVSTTSFGRSPDQTGRRLNPPAEISPWNPEARTGPGSDTTRSTARNCRAAGAPVLGGRGPGPCGLGRGLMRPPLPEGCSRRARVIGADGLALCYPMWPMAKPPIRAALTAASGPAPLVTGRHPCAPVRGAGPRVADRVDTQPQPRSIRPAASRNTAARRVRRKPGVDYLRRLAGTTERPICGIADPASIEPDPAPIGSVRHVKLNAGHTAGLRRRSGPRIRLRQRRAPRPSAGPCASRCCAPASRRVLPLRADP